MNKRQRKKKNGLNYTIKKARRGVRINFLIYNEVIQRMDKVSNILVDCHWQASRICARKIATINSKGYWHRHTKWNPNRIKYTWE